MTRAGNWLGRVVAALVFSSVLATGANADEFTLRIGAGHPASLTYVYTADTFFVPEVERRVKERTGHSVRFIKAWAGTIAKPDSIIEAVQKGSLDIGLNSVGFELARIRLLNFGFYFPFSPSDEVLSQQLSMRMLAEVPALQESVKPYNVRILYLAPSERYGMNTKFKIERLEDIAGKRIACAGTNAPWVQAVGGVPVQLPISENYQGLQTGMIDGNVYAANAMTTFHLVEVAKYFTNTGFGSVVAGFGAYMNLDTRKRLPKEVVDIIDEVAVETSRKTAEISKLRSDEAETQAVAAGAIVSVLSEAERRRWTELLKDMPAKGAREADEQGLPGTQVYQAFIADGGGIRLQVPL